MILEFPLLVFTVLTGLAAGGYLMSTVFALIRKERQRDWRLPLVLVISLGVGMLGALGHLGHPERFLNALSNPTAMISQEAYWSIPFGCILVIDALLLKLKKAESIVVPIIGSVFGLGLMTVTSIAYFTSYGVQGWPEIPTLFLFFEGDLALGAAFALAFLNAASSEPSESTNDGSLDQRVAVVLSLVFVITLIAEAFVFAPLAVGPWGFIVAGIIAAIGAAMQISTLVGKLDYSGKHWACFAVIAIAVIVSRYAFYAMY